jgi:hypothetical protein
MVGSLILLYYRASPGLRTGSGDALLLLGFAVAPFRPKKP